MRGKFITFEGGEGAGKSTQIAMLTEYLKEKNIEYIVTREPGGSTLSEDIRHILLKQSQERCNMYCEALLIAAARVQHVQDCILPNLKAGKVVLCDRYIHSTYAYQGYGRGIDIDFLQKINAPATHLAMPDFTFFLDIAPKLAFARKDNNIALDRIESEGDDFHQKVYNGFLQLAKQKEQNILQIDANQPKDSIHKIIIQTLSL